jgi:SAM-dependent methyltransferase
MKPLNIVLLCGPTASGKSFATERVLSVDYNVVTSKLDSMYRHALEAAGVPRADGEHYSVFRAAHDMRNGNRYDAETSAEFFSTLEGRILEEIERAHSWGIDLVLEGYTARFADEAKKVLDIAGSVCGPRGVTVSRLQLRPTLEEWNRNRQQVGVLRNRNIDLADERYYERSMAPPEPVPGIQDYLITNMSELTALADNGLKLRRHKWYQRFTLGPISTKGPSDAHEKVDVILPQDVVDKRVLDLCCATGVHAILMKDRGATAVVGIELDTTRYSKGLELKKTLLRHSDVDAHVSLQLGDITEVLPTLRAFDTVSFLGALHYFPDYEGTLASVALVAKDAVYIEFCFAEGEHDTADAPGEVRGYTRSRTGTTIYMGDPDTIDRVLTTAMPDFEVEARTPISPPGAKLVSRREVWRLRRRV